MAATNIVAAVAAKPIPATAPVERYLGEEDGVLAILVCDWAELSIPVVEIWVPELVELED